MLSRDELLALVEAGLYAQGVCRPTAAALARCAVAAECDGRWRQGLVNVLAQGQKVAAGQVDGQAEPVVASYGRHTLVADACDGFAIPAAEQGLARAADSAQLEGYCSLQVIGCSAQSTGVLAPYLEQAADRGLIALGFDVVTSGSDASGPPLTLALPRSHAACLIVDLSAAELAQGHLLLAGTQQQPLPDDWALDDQGRATTDPACALAGGESAGARMALVTGLIAAAVGESADIALHDMLDTQDGPRFILIDPVRLGAAEADFGEQLEAILALATMDREGALPGSSRQDNRQRIDQAGLPVSRALHDALAELAVSVD